MIVSVHRSQRRAEVARRRAIRSVKWFDRHIFTKIGAAFPSAEDTVGIIEDGGRYIVTYTDPSLKETQ